MSFFRSITEAFSCVNTRDKKQGNAKCASQLSKGSTCVNYLKWKDCDSSCNLCACSTAEGTNQEHCSGHGTCEARCTAETCTGAKCKCDEGATGQKCELGLFVNFLTFYVFTLNIIVERLLI